MKLPQVKPNRLVRILKKIGCIELGQSGSHKIFRYPRNNKKIVVPMHTKDLKKGLLHSIITRDLEMSIEEFNKL